MKLRGLLLVVLLLGSLNLIPTVNTEPSLSNVDYTKFDATLDTVKGELTLSRWGDTQVKITVPSLSPSSSSLIGEKTELEYPDYKCSVYETAHGIEWDIILASKPTVNAWSLKVDSQLNWYYQPPLTEEFNEKDCLVWTPTYVKLKTGQEFTRPENVTGSYAVYGNEGGNQYKAGKFMHVPRPKIYDAVGGWTWGELHYENRVLSITIDDEWLRNAQYPVIVDPTFGYKSQGGSSSTHFFASYVYAIEDEDGAGKTYTLSEAGDVTRISAYLNASASKTIKTGIYDLSGGCPNNRKVVSDATAVGVSGWYNFSASVSLGAGDYAFAVGEAESAVTWRWWYDSGGTNNMHYRTGTMADPFNCEGHSDSNRLYSIYATYTVAGGPTHFERNATLGITWSGAGDRAWFGGRVGAQNFTIQPNGSRTYTGGRSPDLPLSLTIDGTRGWEGSRDPSLGIGFSSDGSRQTVAGRAASLVLNFTASATGTLNLFINEFTRTATLALTLAADASRMLRLHRTIVGSWTFNFNAGYAGVNPLIIYVTDSLNQGIESAIIAVWGTAGTLEATGETNSTGYYDAGQVQDGNYTILCSSENHQTSINIYTISTSELIIITLSLIEEAVYMYLPWVLITLLGCITFASPRMIQDRTLRMLSYPISVILWLTAAYIWAVLQANTNLFPITYLHLIPLLISTAWGITDMGSSLSKRDKYER